MFSDSAVIGILIAAAIGISIFIYTKFKNKRRKWT